MTAHATDVARSREAASTAEMPGARRAITAAGPSSVVRRS